MEKLEYAEKTINRTDTNTIDYKISFENKKINTHIDKETSKNKVVVFSYYFIKRVFDIVAGLVGCILLIPMTLLVYIARIINKENDGPLFYEQIRIGKNGKQFRLYKFRSMCMNAEEKLDEYLEKDEKAREEFEKYKKLKFDPRITKTGKFIRNTSIDEFPQFINILIGNMSLVGPRPYLKKEEKCLGSYYEEIIKVKPGLTGYWQVNGRNNKEFKTRAYLDTYYINHRGIIMDLKIVLKTFSKIFRKEGAM